MSLMEHDNFLLFLHNYTTGPLPKPVQSTERPYTTTLSVIVYYVYTQTYT